MKRRDAFSVLELVVASLVAVLLAGGIVELVGNVRANAERGQQILTDAQRMALIAAHLRSDLAAADAPDGDVAAALAAGDGRLTLRVRRGASLAVVTWTHDARAGTLTRREGSGALELGKGAVTGFAASPEVDAGPEPQVRVRAELALGARRLSIVSTPVELNRRLSIEARPERLAAR